MSDLTFWEPTLGAMDVIISCLPQETQQLIAGRLQLLAKVHEDRGETTASHFSRALSGELAPTEATPKPKPKLVVVK